MPKVQDSSIQRSSSRRTIAPLPPGNSDTDISSDNQHHSPLRKRIRTFDSQDTSGKQSKRQKIGEQHEKLAQALLKSQHSDSERKHRGRDRSAGLAGALATRSIAAVQPPSNGTIITNGAPNTTTPNDNSDLQKRPFSTGATASDDRSLENGKDNNSRPLRSHRLKSELAQYFPHYDEIVNPEPKEKGTLLFGKPHNNTV